MIDKQFTNVTFNNGTHIEEEVIEFNEDCFDKKWREDSTKGRCT